MEQKQIYTYDSLNVLTKNELILLAKKYGIKGYSNLNKDPLINHILKNLPKLYTTPKKLQPIKKIQSTKKDFLVEPSEKTFSQDIKNKPFIPTLLPTDIAKDRLKSSPRYLKYGSPIIMSKEKIYLKELMEEEEPLKTSLDVIPIPYIRQLPEQIILNKDIIMNSPKDELINLIIRVIVYDYYKKYGSLTNPKIINEIEYIVEDMVKMNLIQLRILAEEEFMNKPIVSPKEIIIFLPKALFDKFTIDEKDIKSFTYLRALKEYLENLDPKLFDLLYYQILINKSIRDKLSKKEIVDLMVKGIIE